MKNKNVGFLIIGISIIIGIIILIFNHGMTSIVNQSCSHGSECTMYGTIKSQTYLSFAIAGMIFAIGLFFILSKENEKIIYKKIKEKTNSRIITRNLFQENREQIEKFFMDNDGM